LAMAAPMPLDAPVTTATLPVSLLMCFSGKVLDLEVALRTAAETAVGSYFNTSELINY
jgi:hypothetical protein